MGSYPYCKETSEVSEILEVGHGNSIKIGMQVLMGNINGTETGDVIRKGIRNCRETEIEKKKQTHDSGYQKELNKYSKTLDRLNKQRFINTK